ADAAHDTRSDTIIGRHDADAEVRRDADADVEVEVFNDCPDAGSTYIYLFTEANELLAFYPPSAAIHTVGTIDCPLIDPSSTPFSMAVDRSGLAHVLYQDGELFKVST